MKLDVTGMAAHAPTMDSLIKMLWSIWWKGYDSGVLEALLVVVGFDAN